MEVLSRFPDFYATLRVRARHRWLCARMARLLPAIRRVRAALALAARDGSPVPSFTELVRVAAENPHAAAVPHAARAVAPSASSAGSSAHHILEDEALGLPEEAAVCVVRLVAPAVYARYLAAAQALQAARRALRTKRKAKKALARAREARSGLGGAGGSGAGSGPGGPLVSYRSTGSAFSVATTTGSSEPASARAPAAAAAAAAASARADGGTSLRRDGSVGRIV